MKAVAPFVSGCVGAELSEYLIGPSAHLDHAAVIVVKIHLTSHNWELKTAQNADTQYISGLKGSVLAFLSAIK